MLFRSLTIDSGKVARLNDYQDGWYQVTFGQSTGYILSLIHIFRRTHSACQQQSHPMGHPAAVTGLWWGASSRLSLIHI